METPETKYTQSGEVHIAYQVLGQGEKDLVLIAGWVSNIEEAWNVPDMAAWLYRLASFSRLIWFDKRGVGLSDTMDKNLPSLSERIEDIHAVLQACGCKSVTFLGVSEGAAMAIMFANRYPELVEKIILFGGYARLVYDDTYPFVPTVAQHDKILQFFHQHWGDPVGLKVLAPSVSQNPIIQQVWSKYLRRSASPGRAISLYQANIEIDVRDQLARVNVPILLLHRKGDQLIRIENSQYLHAHLPDAELIELEGDDHLPFHGNTHVALLAIESFFLDNQAITNKGAVKLKKISVFFQIKKYLQDHYEKPITMEHLTKQFGLNAYELKVGFKEIIGTPVIAYLSSVRFEAACHYLQETDLSINEIAEKVGYQHANNFSASFKKYFGESPLAWRGRVKT